MGLKHMSDAISAPVVLAVGQLTPGGINLRGTAFAVEPRTFATSYHVVGGADQKLVLLVPHLTRGGMDEYQDTSQEQLRYVEATLRDVDPIRDLALLTVEGSVSFSYRLGDTDGSPPGTSVLTQGYPHAEQGRFVLTRQDTHVGAWIYLTSQGIRSKHIILNVQTRPGQSGSPVFNPATNEAVAMVLGSYAPGGGGGISLGGIDPQTLHQTTHAISVEYIKDMLE
jgi:S1-C subfamily serine protease